MLGCCALIDSSIPAGSDLLEISMKTDGIRKVPALSLYFKHLFSIREYFIVIGKYCQEWDAPSNTFKKVHECSACKPVQMPGPIWDELSKRKPLIPDPEPNNEGGWMSYCELVAQGETSGKYQPSLQQRKGKSTIKNRAKLMRDQCVRGFKQCSDCGRKRLIYSFKRLCADEQVQLASAIQDVEFTCGSHPLPVQHPLRVGDNPLIMGDLLSCQAEMEAAYYSDSRPAALVPDRSDWPLVCAH